MPILNFLIVEDEPLNRQVLCTMLTIMGHQVTEATDGPEALALLTAPHPFDAILLDVQLPGLDGLAVLAALRAHPATEKTPIVCISARARQEDQARARAAGADDYLTKPFRRSDLVETLDAVLTRYGVLKDGDSVNPKP